MQFSKSKLYGISNKKYLSELINIENRKLNNVDKHFIPNEFTIVSNKNRKVFDADSQHKYALKRIVKLLNVLEFPKYIYGGIPGNSYVDNATHHLENNFFLLIDITNFFPSTSDSYVFDFFFNKMQQSVDIAKILTNLATVVSDGKRHLPQGYPSSPILSVLSYLEMYKELNQFAEKNLLTFSAYIDDFTFSSKSFIHPSKVQKVAQIINKYDLNVNKEKTKLVKSKYTNITGVIIDNDVRKAPNSLHKMMFENYLELLNMIKKPTSYNKDQFINSCNKFHGYLSSIKSIEKNNKLHHYYQVLNYVKNTFDVPTSKSRKQQHFKKKYVPD